MFNKAYGKDVPMLEFFGIGYVAVTNHKDCNCQWDVTVFPIDKLTLEIENMMLYKKRPEFNNGTINIQAFSQDEKVKVKIKEFVEKIESDKFWDEYETDVEITRSRTLTAKWLGSSDYNRVTAPCLHRGDFVILYKLGDDVNFYWELLMKRVTDPSKRFGESITQNYHSTDNKSTTSKAGKSVPKSSSEGTLHDIFIKACSDSNLYSVSLYEKGSTKRYNKLAMESFNYYYIDSNSNSITVLMEDDKNPDTMNTIMQNKIQFYSKNDFYAVAVNNEAGIFSSKQLSLYSKSDKLKAISKTSMMLKSKQLMVDMSNVVSFKTQSFLLTASAITLQGNVVIDGNLVITGSASPNSCPCCCLCPAGGGGGGGSEAPSVVDDLGSKMSTIENKILETKNLIEPDKL